MVARQHPIPLPQAWSLPPAQQMDPGTAASGQALLPTPPACRACVEGVCEVLPKLLSTAPSAPRGLCFSSHSSARLGGTFPISSLVHQSKTFSHRGANGPGAAWAAGHGQGTRVMPTHETHAYLFPRGSGSWLPEENSHTEPKGL